VTTPVRVLIIDDSALARQALSKVLSAQGDIEVIGCAHDPFHAARIIRESVPDVVLLDIEMPRMDGITFLRKLMAQHPIPTVICSSLAEAQSVTAVMALEAGAVDIILKPMLSTRAFFEKEAARIGEVVRAAAGARLSRRPRPGPDAPRADAVKAPAKPVLSQLRTTEAIVAVGSSTGGTEALRVLLEGFGPESPAVAIVQHMPAGFTAKFAHRLNQSLRVRVREARDKDPLLPGQVLIAPGDRHMAIRASGARFYVEIVDGPPVNRHRPAVDVLFDSVADQIGKNAIGVILTGMGDDGARGLLRMRLAGAATIGQDQETCIVYGMPREAAKMGAVTQELPLDGIAPAIHQICATRAAVTS
jgi:two-component system, chemotaxis family, protein-glutamate methylesterase/glutaminase